jgi:hypothetical protein
MLRVLLVLFATILVLSNVQAASLCPTAKAQGESEGAWPIPEEAFTKQAAERELQKLQRLLGPDGLFVDSIAWENSFVYLEGWYLKRQALEETKRGERGLFVSDFCAFMKKHAYVRH